MYLSFKKRNLYLVVLLCYSLFFTELQSCRPKNETTVPPAVSHLMDSLKKRSYGVPVDSGFAIQQQISVLAKQYGLTEELIRSYCRLGYFIGRTQMNFSGGKVMLDSAAQLVKETGSKKMQPVVDLYSSVLYNGHDDSLSSYYMEQVVPRLDELIARDKITVLIGIGNLHSQRGNDTTARKYYFQALDIAEKQNPRDFKTEIALHDVLGITYSRTNDTLSAIKERRKALALCTDSIERLGEIEYFYSNFGQFYIDIGKPDSALPLIQKYAKIVNRNYTEEGSRLLPNFFLAEIALLKKEYKKADSLLAPYGRHLDTMNMTSRSLPTDWIVSGYYETLYKVKKAQSDYAGAMKALEDEKKFDDLINDKKKDDKLTQYDQNLENTKLAKALAEQEKKDAHNRLILLLVIFLLLLTIAISMAIFFRNKKRLEEQKLKELRQAAVIEKKELMLEIETTERKRIAQEFHDELGGALTIIGMATQALKQLNIEAIASTIDILQRNNEKLTTQINEIVWSLNDRNDKLSSLLAYIRRYAEQFLSDAGLSHTISLSRNIDELPVDGYKRRYLFHAIKECLNNVVKHSRATTAYFSATTTPGMLVIIIEDNGKGMPGEQQLIKGNGIDNIRDNIRALGGSVRWEKGVGTCVVIEVPLKKLGKENLG